MSEYFGFSDSDGLGFGAGIFASLEPDTNHVEKGLACLPSQFFDSELVKTVLRISLEEIQEIEQAIYDFKRKKNVDDATGFLLDIIGEQVGIRRNGLPDDEFRVAIKTQIVVNSSEGQTETLVNLWRSLLGADNATVRDEYPAGVRLFSGSAIPTRDIIDLVSKVVPVTVRLGFVSGVTGSPFCFAGNTGLGFSSVEAPTAGGQFVSIIST